MIKQKSSQDVERKKDALEDIRKRRSQKTFRKEESESEDGEIEDDHRDVFEDSNSIMSDDLSSIGYSDDEKNKKKENYVISLSDLEKVKLSRSFIEKYHDLPIFEEMIKGGFVKINIADSSKANQNGYLLGQVKLISENSEKPYSFAGKKITKYLLISHANSEKLFTYSVISNSPITDYEFKVWFDRMEKVKFI